MALIYILGGGFLHIYLAVCLVRGVKSRLPALAVMLAYGAFVPAYLYRRQLGDVVVTDAVITWLALVFLICLFLVVRDVLEVLALGIDRLRGSNLRARLSARKTVLPAVAIGILAFCYSLYEATDIRIMNVRVATAKLPPGIARVRVAVVADTHIIRGTPARRVDRMVAMVNAQNPDYVLAVGDIVDGKLHPNGPHAKALGRMRGRLGKYAVIGNHEVYNGVKQASAFIEGAGFTLLRGKVDNSGCIAIAGVDDRMVRKRRGIVQTLGKADRKKFVLLLSHRPEAPAGSAELFDLEVSGHSHGGQLWPWRLAMPLVHGFGQGFTALPRADGGHALVYVSNGVGQARPPCRFLTPPEITVIDIEGPET